MKTRERKNLKKDSFQNLLDGSQIDMLEKMNHNHLNYT